MFYQKIWANLPSEIEHLFESSSKTLSVKRGESVYRQGDSPKGIYFLDQGLVGLALIGASSGKEHLVRFFKEGQFFGHRSLFANEGHHATATALQACEVHFLSKQIIEKAFQIEPKLYKEVVQVLSRELRRAEVQHVLILENQVLSRAAQSIVFLKELHPEHKWTRQEIANFCASTTSTIIKALASLEERGLISQKGREIHILDREGLISLNETEQI